MLLFACARYLEPPGIHRMHVSIGQWFVGAGPVGRASPSQVPRVDSRERECPHSQVVALSMGSNCSRTSKSASSRPGIPCLPPGEVQPTWQHETPWRVALGERLLVASVGTLTEEQCDGFELFGDSTWCKKVMKRKGVRVLGLSYGIEERDLWSEKMSNVYGMRTKLFDCFIPPARSPPMAGTAPNGTKDCGRWPGHCYQTAYEPYRVCLGAENKVIHGRKYETLSQHLAGRPRLSTHLKIDSEGTEWAVLEQFLASPADQDRVRTLEMEVHFSYVPEGDDPKARGLSEKARLERRVSVMERLLERFAVSGSGLEAPLPAQLGVDERMASSVQLSQIESMRRSPLSVTLHLLSSRCCTQASLKGGFGGLCFEGRGSFSARPCLGHVQIGDFEQGQRVSSNRTMLRASQALSDTALERPVHRNGLGSTHRAFSRHWLACAEGLRSVRRVVNPDHRHCNIQQRIAHKSIGKGALLPPALAGPPMSHINASEGVPRGAGKPKDLPERELWRAEHPLAAGHVPRPVRNQLRAQGPRDSRRGRGRHGRCSAQRCHHRGCRAQRLGGCACALGGGGDRGDALCPEVHLAELSPRCPLHEAPRGQPLQGGHAVEVSARGSGAPGRVGQRGGGGMRRLRALR